MGGEDKKLDKEKVLEFYSREDIQDSIAREAKDKEIGMKYDYGDKYGYGKRPDVINNPADVLELAKNGATSFHFSEETWKDPLQIGMDLNQKEIEELRKGWDLIIDIDTPHFEYSRIAAYLIVEALKHHGIKSIMCKFSGNHGFHIGVPFEAFPKRIYDKETRKLFPEGPRKIALYLKEMVRPHLEGMLLEKDKMEEMAKNVGKEEKELIKNGKFDPFEAVDIDTVLISSRHLCRMPYTFNEKSGLISTVIKPEDIMKFNRDDATPDKVKEIFKFFDRENVEEGEATNLFIQSFDPEFIPYVSEEEVKGLTKEREYQELEEAVPEELFPPCIKHILKGVDDGKKRCVFILLNFLSNAGWSWEMIEEKVKEWNGKNKEPLREVYWKSQLKYVIKNGKKLPPNCTNEMYYTGMKFCFPDNLCNKIKNPVNYVRRKVHAQEENNKKGKKKNSKKEEQHLNKKEQHPN